MQNLRPMLLGWLLILGLSGCFRNAAPTRTAPVEVIEEGPLALTGVLAAAEAPPEDVAAILARLPGPISWAGLWTGLAPEAEGVVIPTNTTPTTIGVLLPLSGRYAAFGRAALEGVKLGAGVFEEGDLPAGGLQVIIRDTAGDPRRAVFQLEDLVWNQGVVAIIGPMFREEVLAASARAEELEVPLIALSGLPDLTVGRTWVFRNFLTLEAQAARLVAHATEVLGIKRFAILHPRTGFGTAFADVFRREVEARRGRVETTVVFDPGTRDFRKTIRELKGKLAAGAVSGLFVPAGHQTVAMVAPGLAYEDVILEPGNAAELGRIRRSLSRSRLRRVVLLGGQGFHHPQLLTWAGRYVEGALFCDGFFAGSQRPAVLAFVQAFADSFDGDPDMLAAQGYDTARILKQVIAATVRPDRLALRDALLGIQAFVGATGTTSIRPDGDVEKRPFLLTVRGGKIVEWMSPLRPES